MRTFAQKPKATQQANFTKTTTLGRAHFKPSRDVNSILHLQRTIGNQAVQRLLQINAEERNVVLTSTASPHFGHDFSRIPVSPPAAGAIQSNSLVDVHRVDETQPARRALPDPQARSRREELLGDEPGRPAHEPDLSSPRQGPISSPIPGGDGQPLRSETRSLMESRLGFRFDRVRIHTDPRADASARDPGASTFTVSDHVYFRRGTYAPSTAAGQRLFAHELVHVAQQRRGSPLHASPTAMPAGQTARPPMIQRYPVVEDVIHQPIIDQFRQEMGYPPGGIDPATGQQVGPTDAELKYGGILRQWIQNRRQRGGTTAPSQQLAQQAGCNLRIAGPSSVDHYCAAYTPSRSSTNVAANIATCGVYPAPNIRLRVTGQPAGQVVHWSFPRGGNQAQIVGSANNPTVTIRGVRKSARRNDVTVQVTSGTCRATHSLSVLEPSHLTSRSLHTSTSSTLVSASLEYTVLDQFRSAMGANICIDETVIECDSPYQPGVIRYQFSDHPTNAQGKAIDNIFVRNLMGIPAGFCVKLDQDITAGGCGPLGRNIILIRAGGITVSAGDCTPGPSSTCP